MKKLSLAVALMLGFSFVAFGGGGIGGGPPPAAHVRAEVISDLIDGALEGELIRYVEPGSEPVYLLPDIDSIKPSSISAKALPNGKTTVFCTESDADKTQDKQVASFARTITGELELIEKAKPTIDTVPVSDIDQETLDKITAEPKAD